VLFVIVTSVSRQWKAAQVVALPPISIDMLIFNLNHARIQSHINARTHRVAPLLLGRQCAHHCLEICLMLVGRKDKC
jgi:hypothetical protein